jgi:hypothetical protein
MAQPFPACRSNIGEISSVNIGNASTLLLIANPARVSLFIEFPPGSSGVAYISFGQPATLASHSFWLGPGDVYWTSEPGEFAGVINAIIVGGPAQPVLISELT